MNGFAKGLLVAMAFTTPEGREITQKVAKTGATVGSKLLRNKYGIDIKELFSDETEEKLCTSDTAN